MPVRPPGPPCLLTLSGHHGRARVAVNGLPAPFAALPRWPFPSGDSPALSPGLQPPVVSKTQGGLNGETDQGTIAGTPAGGRAAAEGCPDARRKDLRL